MAKNSNEDRQEQVRREEELNALASTNGELSDADHVVNHEPQAARGEEIERRPAVRVHGNRTLQGMPSDVHAALVALSNLHRNEAAAYDEVTRVLEKYQNNNAADELNPEVQAHLQKYADHLRSKHQLYHQTRARLEENV